MSAHHRNRDLSMARSGISPTLVRRYLLTCSSPQSFADINAAVGGSMMSVKWAIHLLRESGDITLGPDDRLVRIAVTPATAPRSSP